MSEVKTRNILYCKSSGMLWKAGTRIYDNDLIDDITDLQAALTEIAQHNGCSAVLKKIASDALEMGR